VRCAKVKFCATGPQLVLRDGSAGNGDDSDQNADKIKWLRPGVRDVPVSADGVVSALAPDGRALALLDPDSGKPQLHVPLRPIAGAPAAITAAPTDVAELIWAGGRLYAVRAGQTRPDWSLVAPGTPSVVSPTGEDVPPLASVRTTVLAGGQVGLVDGRTGRISRRLTVPHPADAVAYPLGSGLLVTGSSGVTAYR
jgi:hypothetical protein